MTTVITQPASKFMLSARCASIITHLDVYAARVVNILIQRAQVCQITKRLKASREDIMKLQICFDLRWDAKYAFFVDDELIQDQFHMFENSAVSI